ncbi:MAG TPA: HU family DNA-binding protein [Patescibacteria group bacterium]|nr:HU family DNA-binding protein [Patescibacteria group bacterium]
MNKVELIEQLASKTNLVRKQAEDAVNGLIEIVTSTLKSGGEVTLTGFGTFSARRREARMGVNPQKPGEKIQIPAVTVPKFKAGKTLKDALKNP